LSQRYRAFGAMVWDDAGRDDAGRHDGHDERMHIDDEIDVRTLGMYVEPTTDAQAKLGVVGVPTTLLIDSEGREVGRCAGPAEWDGPGVAATIQRYLLPRKR
jgi:hypothetical protein